MKNLQQLLYGLVVVILLVSCQKDEGNYDYIELPEVDFSKMPDDINAILGANLIVKGDIVTTIPESDLEYAWYFIEHHGSSVYVVDTFSVEKDLNVVLPLPAGNDYVMYYTVHDIKNNARYDKIMKVDVTTPFTTGWAILKEKNGMAELDFISETIEGHYKDVLTNISEVSLNGKPLQLDMFDWDINSFAIVLTDEGGAFFEASSWKKIFDVLDRFRTIDHLETPFTGGFLNNHGFNSKPLFFAGGKIYAKGGYGPDESWWEVPVVADYSVSNCVSRTENYIILFDEKNRRYISMDIWFGGIDEIFDIPVNDPVTAAFDPGNLEKDCIWMETVAANNGWVGADHPTIAILKDDAGVYYLQKFRQGWFDGFTAEFEMALPAGSIDDNSRFVNNPSTFTYLTQGNKIHRFNRQTDGVQLDYLSMEADIQEIGIDYDGNVLAIVIDNGSGSTLIMLDLLNEGTELARYNIDAKVVDLKYI